MGEEDEKPPIDVEIRRIDVIENQKVRKGIACVEIKDWGIVLDNITWKYVKGRVVARLPGIKRKEESFFYLIVFEERLIENTIKRAVVKAVQQVLWDLDQQ